MNAPAICIMGPTASGKTDLALRLATFFPAEIISVDSTQIYQEMNIGTGKVSKEEQLLAPHHLIDILDPQFPYSAALFCENALTLIQQIQSRQRVPLLVGGTMMYFKALQQGLSPLPPSDPQIRARLNQLADNQGLSQCYARLIEIDPITANQIKPNDKQRILRALEVFELSQKPVSAWLTVPPVPPSCEFINIALMPLETPREKLHQRIETRFDHMLAQGLVNEVLSLFQRGNLSLSMPSLKSVGYRQVWQYLLNELTYPQMREKAIAATRQLAKRQMTWLRHWENVTFFDFDDSQLVEKVNLFLNQVIKK